MTTPLAMRNVGAGYGRRRPVLRDVTLTAAKGSITGLLGRNGAGKTTLLHTALGLKKPSHGRAELFGHEAWDAPPEIRRRLGFVPEDVRDFHWLTVAQCLRLVGGFYDRWDDGLVTDLRQRWGLGDELIGSLSPGLRQRAALLLAVGHRPDLLVLDEPVASLDPGARRDFLRLIGDLNAETEQTVLLSSHICSDVERICSEVAILHDGRIAVHGGIDELKEEVRWVVGVPDDVRDVDVLARAGDRVWLRNWRRYDLSGAARVDDVSLEEMFLDITS